MNIAVLGCGSIGKKHIQNLTTLEGISLFAYDPSETALQSLTHETVIKYSDIDRLFSENKFDAIFVCAPYHLHVELVKRGLENDCHVFVEKPISDTLEGLEELQKLAEAKSKIVFVGCNMRFHSPLQRIKKILDSGKVGKVYSARLEFGHYLPNWRPNTDYSKTYSARHDMGGGVILDSIHELDYANWLFGKVSRVACFADKLSELNIDVEDSAEIIMKLANNSIVEIHLDYLQRFKRRSCQVIGSEGTIIWTSEGKKPEKATVSLYDARKDQWEIFEETVDANIAFIDQMKHFINCIKGIEEPISNIQSGIEALKLVMAARKSSKDNSFIDMGSNN
ncbi:Gfo/Idh/MocA family protein [Nanoarchaeota archaeon]